MIRHLTASPVVLTDCHLGEAPLWDESGDRLLWLDVTRQALHTYVPDRDQHSQLALPWHASCLALTTDDRLVVAGQGGVRVLGRGSDGRATSDPATDQPPPDAPALRVPFGPETKANDGACDPQGRLWIGSADETATGMRGVVFRVASDGGIAIVRQGLSMSNGIGWAPDGRCAYHVDTGPRRLDALDLDEAGHVSAIRHLLEFDEMPDGLAVDVDGGIWLAFWDGGVVRRYSPKGKIDTIIDVPTGYVTSCAFGSPGGSDLFITTAAHDRVPGRSDGMPPPGSLFHVNVGTQGSAVHRFDVAGLPHDATAGRP